MPNIAAVLKAEIARVARKEVRAETEGLRKSTVSQRSEIATLKRRIQELEKHLKALGKPARRDAVKASLVSAAESEGAAEGLRFRAAGMAANRKRLGLSAEDFGLLV